MSRFDEQRFYTAIINYDFEEMEILYRKIQNEEERKKYKFLIKIAKIKHSFKL